MRNLLGLPQVVPFLKLIQTALLGRHAHSQGVEGSVDLTHLEVNSRALKPQAVTFPFFEAWWFVVSRGDFEKRAGDVFNIFNPKKLNCMLMVVCLTVIVIVELHGEVDVVGKDVQVLHKQEEFPDEQHRGSLGVLQCDLHLHTIVPVVSWR